MNIQFPVSKPVLKGNELRYVTEAVESSWISSTGAFVSEFEKQVSDFIGVEEGLSVANGTMALHLACLALGLQPGEEVVVPSLTYIASANAIAYCGAKPVFADCDPYTWNMTPQTLLAALTRRTVGVMAVHLYGLPCDMHGILDICRERGLWVIEDCAESLGASIFGRRTGSFGDAAVFSFYGNKTISTGEGGMLLQRDPKRRAMARLLRGQGMDLKRRYWHPVMGYNYRMTNVAAAIGCGQMEMVNYHLQERRRIAAAYSAAFAPAVERGDIALQHAPDGFASSHWLASCLFTSFDADNASAMVQRELLMQLLLEQEGIETRPFFHCCHTFPMYAAKCRAGLGASEYVSARGINLPTYSGLEESSISSIAGAVMRGLAQCR